MPFTKPSARIVIMKIQLCINLLHGKNRQALFSSQHLDSQMLAMIPNLKFFYRLRINRHSENSTLYQSWQRTVKEKL
jgi:hypothetical protein